MANKDAIMDKIARNMRERGYGDAVSRSGEELKVVAAAGEITVSYVPKAGDTPQMGVDIQDLNGKTVLGVGNQAPGQLQMESAAAGQGELLADEVAAVLFAELCGFANDVIVKSAGSELRISGVAGFHGLGE